jgi:polyphosphate kinase 2 (PPK2 family)
MFPTTNLGALERYRVPTDWKGELSDIDPHDREAIPFPRPEAEAATAADIAEIDRLQEVLYAQAKYALLVVLQGPDTNGKDGTIRRVFSPLNPVGAVATSFKKPTPHELAHDFLWRIHKVVPPAGMIGIFNRSHYEDVLVPRVHGLVPADRIDARYCQINAFEQHLVENDVVIRKFYLHISKKEQKSRLEARLKDRAPIMKAGLLQVPHQVRSRLRAGPRRIRTRGPTLMANSVSAP